MYVYVRLIFFKEYLVEERSAALGRRGGKIAGRTASSRGIVFFWSGFSVPKTRQHSCPDGRKRDA